MEGYFDGVLDLYYAQMTTEETATVAPVYGTPAVLAKSIEVTITPTYREGKLYASNTQVRNTKKVDTYGVKINADKVAHAIKAILLGRIVDNKGVQHIKGGSNPAKIALGFACTLDDGTKELWWLYKGEFSEPTKSAKTDGEKIEYQTETMEGNFVRRMNDDELAVVVDTANESIGAGVESCWFSAVYATPAA
jgi:phi13 family phage major tail protein